MASGWRRYAVPKKASGTRVQFSRSAFLCLSLEMLPLHPSEGILRMLTGLADSRAPRADCLVIFGRQDQGGANVFSGHPPTVKKLAPASLT